MQVVQSTDKQTAKVCSRGGYKTQADQKLKIYAFFAMFEKARRNKYICSCDLIASYSRITVGRAGLLCTAVVTPGLSLTSDRVGQRYYVRVPIIPLSIVEPWENLQDSLGTVLTVSNSAVGPFLIYRFRPNILDDLVIWSCQCGQTPDRLKHWGPHSPVVTSAVSRLKDFETGRFFRTTESQPLFAMRRRPRFTVRSTQRSA